MMKRRFILVGICVLAILLITLYGLNKIKERDKLVYRVLERIRIGASYDEVVDVLQSNNYSILLELNLSSGPDCYARIDNEHVLEFKARPNSDGIFTIYMINYYVGSGNKEYCVSRDEFIDSINETPLNYPRT